jgi:sugar O-acyltransferase (sialic acid O-acetyltransferase NeuD family)
LINTKTPILLVGAGGHARACLDVIECQGFYSIWGLIGITSEVGNRILNSQVIGDDNDLPKLQLNCSKALVAIGQIKNCMLRFHVFQKLVELGYQLPVIISPRAYVSPHARIGKGTIVMHGVIVNAGAQIGDNCIINNQSLIEHDAVVENHCHVSTGAIVNGGVMIGEGSFVGSRSVLKENIQIGKHSLIGMGLSVRHSLPDETFLSANN